MSKHDPKVALNQILFHAREAIELCNGKSRADLDSDRIFNLALTRLIEIIGEAANRISTEIQIQYSDIPWFQMVGARNRLIHGYDNVDFDILWMIVSKDLPSIILKIEKILIDS